MKSTSLRSTNLKVYNIDIKGFLFKNQILFKIPLRDAEVSLENITFTNCIFYDTTLLRDTYSEYDAPYKKIVVRDYKYCEVYT